MRKRRKKGRRKKRWLEEEESYRWIMDLGSGVEDVMGNQNRSGTHNSRNQRRRRMCRPVHRHSLSHCLSVSLSTRSTSPSLPLSLCSSRLIDSPTGWKCHPSSSPLLSFLLFHSSFHSSCPLQPPPPSSSSSLCSSSQTRPSSATASLLPNGH